MAKVELQYGKDPAMRKLAGAIVAAQKNEIVEMPAGRQSIPPAEQHVKFLQIV